MQSMQAAPTFPVTISHSRFRTYSSGSNAYSSSLLLIAFNFGRVLCQSTGGDRRHGHSPSAASRDVTLGLREPGRAGAYAGLAAEGISAVEGSGRGA